MLVLKKQNYKGFYQHNGPTAGIVQVCQPHLNNFLCFAADITLTSIPDSINIQDKLPNFLTRKILGKKKEMFLSRFHLRQCA